MSILTAALCAAICTAPADSIDLTAKLKEGAESKYQFTFAGGGGGFDVEFTLDWTQKVGKKGDKGVTAVHYELSAPKVTFGGEVQEDGEGSELDLNLDKHGMPTNFGEDNEAMFIFVSRACQFLPAKSVEVGSDFEIKWEAGEASLEGKGTLKGTKEVDGKSLVLIAYEAVFSPDGEQPADVEIETFFDPKNMSVVKSSGTASMDQGDFDLTLKLVK
jgi:hypothetical protein